MDERLTKACEAEFAKFIEGLFANPKMCGYRLAEVPVIGGVYFVDNSNDDYATKIPLICAALAARERFRREAPGFSELPLHLDDLMYARWSTDPQTLLKGLFAYSLANVQWDYDQHPCFCRFACGLNALEICPSEIRNDKELQLAFPAHPLDRLHDQLHWQNAEDLEMYRQHAELVAKQEAARVQHEELMALQAKIERAGESHPTHQ
jgi:hypothetical protein